MIESKGAARAKSYFTQGLSREDYYTDGQEIAGRWGGKGAERLMLSGQVERAGFAALCDNLRPDTGERLTGRTQDGRRVGYDFNFHVPKSVSAVYELTGDEAILSAFRVAVRETMEEMEAEMHTRVRKGGKDETRPTGNIVYAEFIHRTARPVAGGLPDPHLHAHCFVFNATYDAAEQQWKAGEFGNIKRDAPYYEAAFHARLAAHITALGYGVLPTAKGWEIAGVPASVIEKFSNRTAEIEAEAKRRGITDLKAKDQLGAQTRRRKRKDVGMEALRQAWAERLTPDEWTALSAAADGGGARGLVISDKAAMEYAVAHRFERQSVVSERQLQATALRYGVGSVSVEGVQHEAQRPDILTRNLNGQRLVTTRQVLAEEKAMLHAVKEERGRHAKLGRADFRFQDDRLNAEQRAAVLHVLRSRDGVIGIRGGAGVGKTTLMREAVRGIGEGGRTVFTFAPSSSASRGTLREEGFATATTVAALLASPDKQAAIKGQVIWIDEAGQVGARQMGQVVKLAREQEARVILSGDVGQHSAVERGDALRLLESHAGLKVARVNEIQRQRGTYKQAVAAISQGKLQEGFERLEALHAILELPDEARYAALAGEYVQGVKRGKSVLAVAPTHAEGAKVTEAVRAALRSAKKIEASERRFLRLENVHLTEAQRGDARQYKPGLVVQFTMPAKGFQGGTRLTVSGVTAEGRVEAKDAAGQVRALPLHQAERFQVYAPSNVALAKGDRLRITQNGFSLPGPGKGKGHRLDNGALYEVAGFTSAGDIALQNGWVLRKDYGHMAYGYCSTSHSAQSKTVDLVLIAQSAASLPASSREQFYVSVSRGREAVRIFTDNQEALREAVADSAARMSATELQEQGSRPARAALEVRRHTERLRQFAGLARIHAARAVETVKDVAKQISGPQSWAQKVRPKEREIEMG